MATFTGGFEICLPILAKKIIHYFLISNVHQKISYRSWKTRLKKTNLFCLKNPFKFYQSENFEKNILQNVECD